MELNLDLSDQEVMKTETVSTLIKGAQDFQRITSPIGLEIKAETPAEIAISIAGQLIELRARRSKEPV